MTRLTGSLLALALLATGCAETSIDGAVLYTRYCAACHGADQSGGVGPALVAGSEAAALSDQEYREVITQGAVGMPATTGLNEDQLDALIAHIRRAEGS